MEMFQRLVVYLYVFIHLKDGGRVKFGGLIPLFL